MFCSFEICLDTIFTTDVLNTINSICLVAIITADVLNSMNTFINTIKYYYE